MAKNNGLFGLFLCVVVGVCIDVGSTVVGSYRQPAIGHQLRAEVDSGVGDEALGAEGSRDEVLGDRDSGDSYQPSAFSSEPLDIKQAASEDLIRSKIKSIYSAEIGVREETGKNDGKRVEEYLAITKLGPGYAWCSSFVSWVFAEAGFPEPRTPWSPALFPKERVIWERGLGSEVLGNRPNRPGTSDLKPNSSRPIPATADIFGIYFDNLKRIAHAGFVDEWGDKYLVTTEGNTNESGGNEGDGVYRKRRLISSIYQVADWVSGQERIVGPERVMK